MKNMIENVKSNISTISWLLLVCSLVSYLGVLAGLFDISVVILLKFLLMNVISIMLPGYTIMICAKIKCSKVSTFFVSYILGYAFSVIEYFLSELLNRSISFLGMTVIGVIFSVVLLLKKKGEVVYAEDDICDFLGVFFFAIFLFFSIFSYAAPNVGTSLIEEFTTHRDMQYWVGNSVALKASWPADNLFILGDRLNYHYFSNIPIAFLSDVYSIDVYTMSFSLYAFTKAMVMVGSVCFLLKKYSVSALVSFCGYTVILCTTGIESLSVVTYVHHILLSPFGFDISFAYGIFFITLLLTQWENDKLSKNLVLCTIMVWCMCTGAKAPIAVVLLLFAGLICFGWIIQKKLGYAFIYGILILGSFLIICKFCIGMFDVIEGDSAWQLGIYSSEKIQELYYPETWDSLGKKLTELGSGNVVWAIIIRCFSVNPVVICITIFCVCETVWQITRGKRDWLFIYSQGALLTSAIFGLLLGVFENAGGNSEMYFSMAALIPMFLLILKQVEGVEKNRNQENKSKRRIADIIFWGVMIIPLVIGVYRFCFSAWDKDGAIVCSINGLQKITGATEYQNSDEVIKYGIRKSDIEALSWIRDNAETDAIVISDKAIINDLKSYYLYGVFCERQQYLEGRDMLGTWREDINAIIEQRTNLIHNIFNNVDGAIDEAGDEGVDYIVQTIDITPDFRPNEGLELVAHSNTINIYKVK